MYQIIKREELAPVTRLFEVHAPRVAAKAKAGQFVIVRTDERGERVPLTIADFDRAKGTVTIIFQIVGKTTEAMDCKQVGDALASFAGPLGLPSEVEPYGAVVVVGGGVGIAPIYPIARALREANNYVISIIGARNRDLLFWEEKMRAVSDDLIVCTDDGSHARKALVTEPLKELLEARRGEIKRVWAVGPAIMMKFCSLTTKPFEVPTIVSLNSIMVDGTGMCGACRVEVGGKTRFVCVDGPEFDGHEVDWNLLLSRQRTYLDEEKRAVEHYHEHRCRCGDAEQAEGEGR
ncbi:MAG: sulfide/dihydroorotate dehydrogenase-like FAD/NAD-binding protein [Chloroflexi bacterium]|nr:sulfide/dihydroorotate dehydrogenase-like FAD/NAD-binding protein [Chloroflexota bacterium]